MNARSPLSPESRAARLARLRSGPPPEVLVIGGGINGISTFRELALQGVRVALVEKDDYCSGASGALSRMIHGGLRYMETGEFALVRESLAERNRLLRNAPHYVSPLPTTVPLFDYASGLTSALQRLLRLTEKPARRGAVLVKVGLSLYDLFTGRASGLPRHSFKGRAATFRRWPHLNPEARCTGTYHDAQITYPERLGLELVQDAMAANPEAIALNHVALEAVGPDGTLTLADAVSGARLVLKPGLVVNAGGAWTDAANRAGLAPEAPRLIGGTKGSHLIVDNPVLYDELGDEMIYYENQEGRVCILFRYFDRVLIGSTDIRVDSAEGVACTPEEQAYILDSVRFIFPEIDIRPEEIVFSFAGVRPLPWSGEGSVGRISRNHFVHEIAPAGGRDYPVFCLIGGKWTTFRAFGELVADKVLARLGRPRLADTRALPIGGGRGFPAPGSLPRVVAELAAETGLPEPRLRALLSRYGMRAAAVARACAREGDAPLPGLPGYSAPELRHLVREEDVVRAADLLLRRTSIAITGRLTGPAVESVLSLMADTLGWSREETAREGEALRARLAARHGVSLPPLAPLPAPADATTDLTN